MAFPQPPQKSSKDQLYEDKLEQKAWELFKLLAKDVEYCPEAKLHQIPWCYELAREFMKYSEEIKNV